MTPNERKALEGTLSVLSNTQVDLYVYQHSGNKGSTDLYNYRALGKAMLTRRMLAELLGYPQLCVLPGEYYDEEDPSVDDLSVYTPATRSGDGEPLTEAEKMWLIDTVLVVMDGIGGINDGDDACLRVSRRRIAEVAGYPHLNHYRLMMETEVTPKFFPDYVPLVVSK